MRNIDGHRNRAKVFEVGLVILGDKGHLRLGGLKERLESAFRISNLQAFKLIALEDPDTGIYVVKPNERRGKMSYEEEEGFCRLQNSDSFKKWG